MNISDLLSIERVRADIEVSSKKNLLETASELLALGSPALTPTAIFDSLNGRERLGSTGLGGGIAIPHGRTAGTRRPIGAFLRIAPPIAYDAVDGNPVDLVFALLVPEDSPQDHLELLSKLAGLFNESSFIEHLRSAPADTILEAFLDAEQAEGEASK
ncbi:MAG: PTS sugar transporter subunit IIA [Chromatiales bacterium]|nr:PTS sugar transporter subunit IIA [Chromatiales bacterium]